jgi:hypothetical protein
MHLIPAERCVGPLPSLRINLAFRETDSLRGVDLLINWNKTMPADRQQLDQGRRELCRAAAVCKKYDTVRLECATAGSFKTCLRVKMGDDAVFANSCNGYNEGGPALPPLVGTPNIVECFFITTFQ